MADDMKKDQGQSGQQSGQQQQHKNPQDVTKKNPAQDRDETEENQGQREQGGQRRAS